MKGDTEGRRREARKEMIKIKRKPKRRIKGTGWKERNEWEG